MHIVTYHDPPHPGEVVRTLCLDPLNLSVTEAAKALGVSRKTLSSLLNGRSGITAEMAIRLAIAFDTTPESWLVQQMRYDLWRTTRKGSVEGVQKLSPKPPESKLTSIPGVGDFVGELPCTEL